MLMPFAPPPNFGKYLFLIRKFAKLYISRYPESMRNQTGITDTNVLALASILFACDVQSTLRIKLEK